MEMGEREREEKRKKTGYFALVFSQPALQPAALQVRK
jgi:hypothetical protein